jgi:tyrosyl-tRNA synthetase
MQGYDSVAIGADVELGGTDQTFNLMMAREIQRDYGQPPEVAVITPLLVGLDGVQKMSKSLGNYVGVLEPPDTMVGKLMSLPDELIESYLLTCTRIAETEVAALVRGMAAGSLNPRDAKLRLAAAVTAIYHGPEAGDAATAEFVRVFSQRALPAEMPERVLPANWRGTVVDLLTALDLAPSRSQARRLVEGGAVEIDGVRQTDPGQEVGPDDGAVVRAGKRSYCRVRHKTG